MLTGRVLFLIDNRDTSAHQKIEAFHNYYVVARFLKWWLLLNFVASVLTFSGC